MSEESASEEVVAEAAPAVEETPPPAEPAAEVVTLDDGVVEGSVDEARQKNWVPYESRFKPLLDERNDLRGKVERLEEERRLAEERQYRQPPTYPQHQEPEPRYERDPYAAGRDQYSEDDPLEIAKRAEEKVRHMEMRHEAERQATQIRADIDKVVNDLGFVNQGEARDIVSREVIYAVQSNGGKVPDIHSIARSVRQREVDLEKSVIDRYRSKKQSPAAAAAAPTSPSPPVIPDAGESKEPTWKRMQRKLSGG